MHIAHSYLYFQWTPFCVILLTLRSEQEGDNAAEEGAIEEGDIQIHNQQINHNNQSTLKHSPKMIASNHTNSGSKPITPKLKGSPMKGT